MKLVKDLKIDDNTIIIFTSDNGASYLGGYDRDFFNGSGPLRGHKGNLYEGGIRVPTVMKWPGVIKPGTSSDHISAFWDFMPTLAEIAGNNKDVPKDCDGISFVNAMKGQKQEQHKYLYWEFYAYNGWQVVRKGDWKAVKKNMSKGNTKLELYNLKDDLAESQNIANKHPEIIREMEAIMKKEHLPNPYFPFKSLGDKVGFKQGSPKNH